MALFFDQTWFDAKLAAVGASREDVGRLLHLTHEQINELWKDQRELTAQNVAQLARFLNTSPAEIALRGGISTPLPRDDKGLDERFDQLETKISRVEALLLELKLLVQSRLS